MDRRRSQRRTGNPGAAHPEPRRRSSRRLSVNRPNYNDSPSASEHSPSPRQGRNVRQRTGGSPSSPSISNAPVIQGSPSSPSRSNASAAQNQQGPPSPPSGSPNAPPAQLLETPPNFPERRSLRSRSGGPVLPLSGSANNRHDLEGDDDGALPQIFNFAEGEFRPPTGNKKEASDVFYVRIDGIDDHGTASILMDLIKDKANQPPLAQYHSGRNINVEPHAISPLPLYLEGSPVFQKVMLVFLEGQEIVTGFIFCGRAPHPNANQVPPQDHHAPPTLLPGGRIYSGFGADGCRSVVKARVDRVKEELAACLRILYTGDGLEEDITVRAFLQESQFIKKLKDDRELLLAGNDHHRIFENNGSVWSVRKRLIAAVDGDHHLYCENGDGGIARFILYPVSLCYHVALC